jgi:hypothetical protein
MRVKLLILICLCFCFDLKASPQAPDYLIIGKDTFAIYFLPINRLDLTKRNIFLRNLQIEEGKRFSFNLWRGFQVFWQIKDDKLYLVGLKGFVNSDSILKVSFPIEYNDGKVLASWFSSYLAISKGKMLKWDGIFSRTYFKEEIFEFNKGVLVNTKTVDNYIDLKNGISRLKRKVITDTIYDKIRRLNWEKLSDCDCDDKYLITIDEKGKIGDIEVVSLSDIKKDIEEDSLEHIKCGKMFKRKLKGLQFDIITWNGKPYKERILFEIFYTADDKLENWTENNDDE